MPSPPELWKAYLAEFPARSEDFIHRRYLQGHLPTELNQALHSAILAAPVLHIDNSSISKGVGANTLTDKYVEALNKDHRYRAFTRAEALALAPILEHIKDDVTAALKSAWRVMNCRIWTTPYGSSEVGPNSWHLDGDLIAILKMMIYCTPIGGDFGGLELKPTGKKPFEIVGDAGQWVLFYNSMVNHRGIAPRKEGCERVAVELTIAPSIGYDLRPKFIGLIGRYPDDPWV